MKASSESGLWATVISRTALAGSFSSGICVAVLLMLIFQPCARDASRCDACGQHNFDNFSENEPVEPEAQSLCERVRENYQPRGATGKQQDFRQHPCCGRAKECSGSPFHDPAGKSSDEWIGKQVSARAAEWLRQASC